MLCCENALKDNLVQRDFWQQDYCNTYLPKHTAFCCNLIITQALGTAIRNRLFMVRVVWNLPSENKWEKSCPKANRTEKHLGQQLIYCSLNFKLLNSKSLLSSCCLSVLAIRGEQLLWYLESNTFLAKSHPTPSLSLWTMIMKMKFICCSTPNNTGQFRYYLEKKKEKDKRDQRKVRLAGWQSKLQQRKTTPSQLRQKPEQRSKISIGWEPFRSWREGDSFLEPDIVMERHTSWVLIYGIFNERNLKCASSSKLNWSGRLQYMGMMQGKDATEIMTLALRRILKSLHTLHHQEQCDGNHLLLNNGGNCTCHSWPHCSFLLFKYDLHSGQVANFQSKHDKNKFMDDWCMYLFWNWSK